MKQQTVYVPEQNGTIVDFAGSESITSCMEITNRTSTYIGIENNFVLKKSNDLVSAHLLQKVENVNILTDSELLELKKKWCEETFEHTLKYAKDKCWSREGMEYEMNETFTNKHKETYLNNLSI